MGWRSNASSVAYGRSTVDSESSTRFTRNSRPSKMRPSVRRRRPDRPSTLSKEFGDSWSQANLIDVEWNPSAPLEESIGLESHSVRLVSTSSHEGVEDIEQAPKIVRV